MMDNIVKRPNLIDIPKDIYKLGQESFNVLNIPEVTKCSIMFSY